MIIPSVHDPKGRRLNYSQKTRAQDLKVQDKKKIYFEYRKSSQVYYDEREIQKQSKEMIPFLVFAPINQNHHLHTKNQYVNMPGSKYKYYLLIEK